jgi:hypothetical protein
MTTTTATTRHTILTTGPVWRVGAIAGATAAVVLYAYGSAASALSVPMKAGQIGARAAATITPGNFAMGTLICSFWGTVLAVLLARWAARPARTFLYSTIALTLVSLVSPLGAAHTAAATKVTLVLAHLLAAAIVIPVLTQRLAHVSRSSFVEGRM